MASCSVDTSALQSKASYNMPCSMDVASRPKQTPSWGVKTTSINAAAVLAALEVRSLDSNTVDSKVTFYCTDETALLAGRPPFLRSSAGCTSRPMTDL